MVTIPLLKDMIRKREADFVILTKISLFYVFLTNELLHNLSLNAFLYEQIEKIPLL